MGRHWTKCSPNSALDRTDLILRTRLQRPVAVVLALLMCAGCSTPSPSSPSPSASQVSVATWRPIEPAPISSRVGHSATWDGREMLVWGGLDFPASAPGAPSGAAYEPVQDAWRVLPEPPIQRRTGHIAAFTGDELLIWGGISMQGLPLADGAAYSPATDSWRLMAPAPAALGGGASYVAAWAEDRWLVVDAGSADDPGEPTGRAASYDPASDTWERIADGPSHDGWAAMAVWADELLVVIRLTNEGPSRGAQYDPRANEWAPLPLNHGLTIQSLPFATWTGDDVLVVRASIQTSHGVLQGPRAWRYVPTDTRWIPAAAPPEDLPYGPPVASGTVITYYAPAGGRSWQYDVQQDRWSALPTVPDRVREGWTTVWTGTDVLVWGGSNPDGGPASADGVALRLPRH